MRRWVGLILGLCLPALGQACGGSHAASTNADAAIDAPGASAGSGGGAGGASGAGGVSGGAGKGGASGASGAGGGGGASGASGGGGASGASGGGGASGAGGGGGASGAAGAGGQTGAAGATGPNCAMLAKDCGAVGDESCCASVLVPGGTFNRSNDPANPATVSDFLLDKFEVSVGRFRGFITSGRGTQASPPAAGAGAHPLIPGTGWHAAWNTNLATDPVAWKAILSALPLHNWADSGANDHQPMNYLNWYEAFAFCIWDGGRLPTEAEWNYAAAGGGEQRLYPWGADKADATRAAYGCIATSCGPTSMVPVGSKPAGNGKWGHGELAGNVTEWIFDWYPTILYKNPCVDCAETTPGIYRVQRGGDYYIAAPGITTEYRWYWDPAERKPTFGVRCARAK